MYLIINSREKLMLARILLLFWFVGGHNYVRRASGLNALEEQEEEEVSGLNARDYTNFKQYVYGPAELGANNERLAISAGISSSEIADALAHRLIGDREATAEMDERPASDRSNFYDMLEALADQPNELTGEESGSDEEWRQLNSFNAHLPATNAPEHQLEHTGLRPPVNEPLLGVDDSDEEDNNDVVIGHLTSQLNLDYPNSSNRTRVLLSLLAQDEKQNADLEQNVAQDLEATAAKSEEEERLRKLAQYLYHLRENSSFEQRQVSTQTGLTQTDDNQASQEGRGDGGGGGGGSEYIDHPLALAGHQLVQGGAGEGRQLLGPDGTFENVQVLKSDSAVPSYCDPPNPCPIGYTAKDGCLERFVNLASFSREYQAREQCSCDNEHSLFNCAAPPPLENAPQTSPSVSTKTSTTATPNVSKQIDGDDLPIDFDDEQKLTTLARGLQNRFGDLSTIRQLIQRHEQQLAANQDGALATERDDQDDNLLVRSARKWSQPLRALGGQHEPGAGDKGLMQELD